MPARWMQSKLLKQKAEQRQDRELAKLRELYDREHYPLEPIEADSLLVEFLAAGGKITRCECVKRLPRESYSVTGKNGRKFDRRVYSQKPRTGLCVKGIFAVS